MRRRALAGLALLVTGCSTWHAQPLPAPVSVERRGTGKLLAGMARVDITPPPGVGMGGSGPEGRRSTGYRTRLYAGALVLEDASGERIALVVADLPHVSANLHRLAAAHVARSHGIGADRLIVSATHTHSGPGHFYGERQYNANASRVPGYDPRITNYLVERIALAVDRAAGSLRPAKLAWDTALVGGAVRNRSVEAYCENPDAAPLACDTTKGKPWMPRLAVDSALLMLRVDTIDPLTAKPHPLGSYTIFAMHPTALPSLNTLLDGDLSVRIVDRLARHGAARYGRPGVHLLANGAEGDVAPALKRRGCDLPKLGVFDPIPMPRGPGEAVDFIEPPRKRVADCVSHALREADRVADSVSARAIPLYDRLGNHLTDHVSIRRAFVTAWLPGRDSLCVSPVLGSATAAGGDDLETRIRGWEWLLWPLFRVALVEGGSAVDRKAKGCQAPKRTLLGAIQGPVVVGEHGFPQAAQLSVVRIGTLLLGSVPAELTTITGARVRAGMTRAMETQGRPPMATALIGLANGFLQYVTTHEEFRWQAYEGGSNLYGPGSAGFLERRLAELAASVASDAPSPSAVVEPITAYPGTPTEILPTPASGAGTPLTDTVPMRRVSGHPTATWWDLPPGNLFPSDAPWVAVERRASTGEWIQVGVDGDGSFEVHAVGARGHRGFEWRAVWLDSTDRAPFRLVRLFLHHSQMHPPLPARIPVAHGAARREQRDHDPDRERERERHQRRVLEREPGVRSARGCPPAPWATGRSAPACRRCRPPCSPPPRRWCSRRQKMQSSSAGKLPLAAMANASDTMNATFCPLKAIPSSTASTPRPSVATRATRSSSPSAAWPCRTTFTQRSCDSAAAPESVSPATTARIVANATAAMNPRNGRPPRSSARSGAAMLPPLSTARIASGPTSTMAPKPSTKVIR